MEILLDLGLAEDFLNFRKKGLMARHKIEKSLKRYVEADLKVTRLTTPDMKLSISDLLSGLDKYLNHEVDFKDYQLWLNYVMLLYMDKGLYYDDVKNYDKLDDCTHVSSILFFGAEEVDNSYYSNEAEEMLINQSLVIRSKLVEVSLYRDEI